MSIELFKKEIQRKKDEKQEASYYQIDWKNHFSKTIPNGPFSFHKLERNYMAISVTKPYPIISNPNLKIKIELYYNLCM